MLEPSARAGAAGRDRRGVLFSVLVALTIMPSGCNLALPGAVTGASWPVPFEVVHGVFVHNVMTLIWMAIALVLVIVGKLRPVVTVRAWRYAALIALLGVIGIVSTLTNTFRYSTMADLGEIARLFVSAFYFVLMSHWAGKYGPAYIMRWFLAGIALGGLINIYFSITAPYNFVGILPFLYSRNGGGGILALSIALSAWTWLLADRRALMDRLTPVAVTFVALVAVGLSFSKTAMLTGTAGLVVWMLVLRASPWVVLRGRVGRLLTITAFVGVLAAPAGSIGSVWTSINQSIDTKFTAVLSPELNGSVRDRLAYYLAVWQIFSANPINAVIGVGFSGFYPAVIQTDAFGRRLVEEELDAGKRSNPHNSFLYYMAACGAAGILSITALYWTFVRAVFRSIQATHRFAYAIAAAIALVYVLYGSALPSLYKTEVIYLPAAAAIAASRRSSP